MHIKFGELTRKTTNTDFPSKNRTLKENVLVNTQVTELKKDVVKKSNSTHHNLFSHEKSKIHISDDIVSFVKE